MTSYEVMPKTSPKHSQLTQDPLDGKVTLHGRGEKKWCNFQLGAIFGKNIRGLTNLHTRDGAVDGLEMAQNSVLPAGTKMTIELEASAVNHANTKKTVRRILREISQSSEGEVPLVYQNIYDEALFHADTTPNRILGSNKCFTLLRFKKHLQMALVWFVDATFDLVIPTDKSGYRQVLIICVKAPD